MESDLGDGQGHCSQVGTFSAFLSLPVDASCRVLIHFPSLSHLLRCRQAPKGEAGGEINDRRGLGSPLAQLHRGSRQRSAFCSDDDGQGEGTTRARREAGERRQLDGFQITLLWRWMSFQAVVAGIQQAHAEQLANMRIQDLNISLKPLNSVNNPILRKRKLLGYDGHLHEDIFTLSYIKQEQVTWSTDISVKRFMFSNYIFFLYMSVQPKAQRRILHPWPRERRRRLQHSAGKAARRHCPVYITTSRFVHSDASLKRTTVFCCLRQEMWWEARRVFLRFCRRERGWEAERADVRSVEDQSRLRAAERRPAGPQLGWSVSFYQPTLYSNSYPNN